MTLTELSKRVGVSLVNLSVLKNDRAKAIRFSTLTAICGVLDCQVGDLLISRAYPVKQRLLATLISLGRLSTALHRRLFGAEMSRSERMDAAGEADWDSVVWIDDALGPDGHEWAQNTTSPSSWKSRCRTRA